MMKVKVAQSCPTLCDPWNSPDQNTGMGSHCLLHQILPTQKSNQVLLLCRQILYQLSYINLDLNSSLSDSTYNG